MERLQSKKDAGKPYETAEEAFNDINATLKNLKTLRMLRPKGLSPSKGAESMLKTSEGGRKEINEIVASKISESLSHGFINDARKLKLKYISYSPLSKDESEYIDTVRAGIENLLKDGGSVLQVINAAYDHGVPIEKLVPAAKDAFKKRIEENTPDSLKSASEIAHAFRFKRSEVRELVYELLA
ncbi:MAG: hypothetical protein ACP5NE_03020 [Candidatus Micrarchaeia archaeon]